MVEARQLDFFPSHHIERSPRRRHREQRRLSPEQKKNIQWFWKYFEYKKKPDAIIGKPPVLDVEDMDPQAQKAAEREYYYGEPAKYEGLPEFTESDILAEIKMKNLQTIPVGEFYANLKAIKINSKLVLIENKKTKDKAWYFAEPASPDLIELREFPADFVVNFSRKFPKEIKLAIEYAQEKSEE